MTYLYFLWDLSSVSDTTGWFALALIMSSSVRFRRCTPCPRTWPTCRATAWRTIPGLPFQTTKFFCALGLTAQLTSTSLMNTPTATPRLPSDEARRPERMAQPIAKAKKRVHQNYGIFQFSLRVLSANGGFSGATGQHPEIRAENWRNYRGLLPQQERNGLNASD